MKGRNVVITLLIILILLSVAVIRRWQEPRQKESFNRQAKLHYTAFAVCQLQCKAISKSSITEVMQKGIIHFNRSNRRRWPCPTYVVQARTKGKRYLRVVFEQCNRKTTILALDDLEKRDTCHCTAEKD